MPKKVKASAGKRIRENGKSLVWVTFNEVDKQKIRMAAASENKPMSQFIAECGLAEADKILKKILKVS